MILIENYKKNIAEAEQLFLYIVVFDKLLKIRLFDWFHLKVNWSCTHNIGPMLTLIV